MVHSRWRGAPGPADRSSAYGDSRCHPTSSPELSLPISSFPVVDSDAIFYRLSLQPIAVDWTAQGDRLIHLVFEELVHEVPDLSGHGMGRRDDPFLHYEYTVTSELLTSRLCIVRMSDGAVDTLVRFEGELNETQHTPWRCAMERAVQRLTEEQPIHQWTAVIGTAGEDYSPQALARPVQVGDFSLTPSPHRFHEVRSPLQPSMGSGGQIYSSVPVVVHGATRGYSSRVAAEEASERLGKLCAALSVALGACWQLRDAPRPEHLDPAAYPDRGAGLDWYEPDDDPPLTLVEAPEWLESALALLDSDEQLLTAVLAHHQGLRMESMSPSYALLAYVAAIEGIGAKYVDLQRCESCGMNKGSTSRFRTALGLVLPPERVRELVKQAYGYRSKTAHEGRLHAAEDFVRSFSMPRVFGEQESRYFRSQYVWPLREASRALLVRALTDDLPEPEAVDGGESPAQ